MALANHQKKRVYRNIAFTQILAYRLPMPGIVSILHRISGVLLFLTLPLSLYLFGQSLASEPSFDSIKAWGSCAIVKLIGIGLVWAYLFHFCAGLRHLCMDVHLGVTLRASRLSAAGVLILSGLLTLGIALKLFGVF